MWAELFKKVNSWQKPRGLIGPVLIPGFCSASGRVETTPRIGHQSIAGYLPQQARYPFTAGSTEAFSGHKDFRPCRDLNPGPSEPQSNGRTTRLQPHHIISQKHINGSKYMQRGMIACIMLSMAQLRCTIPKSITII